MSSGKIYLPCGHPIGCLYSYNIGRVTKRYCFGCVIEKAGVKAFTVEELQSCSNTSKYDVPEVKPVKKDKV